MPSPRQSRGPRRPHAGRTQHDGPPGKHNATCGPLPTRFPSLTCFSTCSRARSPRSPRCRSPGSSHNRTFKSQQNNARNNYPEGLGRRNRLSFCEARRKCVRSNYDARMTDRSVRGSARARRVHTCTTCTCTCTCTCRPTPPRRTGFMLGSAPEDQRQEHRTRAGRQDLCCT